MTEFSSYIAELQVFLLPLLVQEPPCLNMLSLAFMHGCSLHFYHPDQHRIEDVWSLLDRKVKPSLAIVAGTT